MIKICNNLRIIKKREKGVENTRHAIQVIYVDERFQTKI